MGYVRPPVPLWHFHAEGEVANNDLVMVTYDNGSVLYVTKSGERWIVDSELMPKDLQDIGYRYGAKVFEVIRCTDKGLQSGYVGSSLAVQASGGGAHKDNRIRCTSECIVMDISPAIRPKETPQGLSASFHVSE